MLTSARASRNRESEHMRQAMLKCGSVFDSHHPRPQIDFLYLRMTWFPTQERVPD